MCQERHCRLKTTTQEPHPIPKRASLYQQREPTYVANRPTLSLDTVPLERQHHTHFLVFVGVGMLCFLSLYIVWNAFVIPWWQEVQDQWNYGTGRITRFEADVGHGGTSTFLGFVLRSQVIIIEAPNGDMEHARYYKTATLNAPLSPPPVISLSIARVDNISDCLIVHVEGMSSNIVLYNTGSGFQLTKP